MNTLEKEYIYAIHEKTIEEFGGSDEKYDYTDDRIESILSQQYPYFYYDKYPSVFEKSAMLGYFFTKGHCFVDGNKRVGLYVIEVFLNINNHELKLSNDNAELLMIQIASCEFKGEDIDNYIYKLAGVIEVNSRRI
jgi:death-on-curing protein